VSDASSIAARSACTGTSSIRRADETAPLRPGDVYQVTKLEGEEHARARRAGSGVELVIVRPSGIYWRRRSRLLKLFRGVARRRFVILGDGEIFYHLTHIDDLVEGFVSRPRCPAPRAAPTSSLAAK
jgi:nucleoside-diphosphate-sugar epimerase